MSESTRPADLTFIAELRWYYDALYSGVMVVNAALEIVFCNAWLQTRLPAAPRNLPTLFGDHDLHKMQRLVGNAIKHRQSRMLSQSLHKWLIPLADTRFEDGLMRQTCTVSPLECPHTHTIYALVQIRDDSDAVLKTTKLKRIQTRLEDRTAELEASNQELQKSRSKWLHLNKMEALDTMIRGIAHNFNNLLSVILGNTEMLQSPLLPREMAQDCLTDIHNASIKGRNMVRQIVAFNRQSGVELQRMELGEAVEGALILLRVNWPKNITLEWSPSKTGIFIKGNIAMLQQVVINLVTNARQAIHPNHGKVELLLDTQPVTEADRPVNGAAATWARLRVRDNGHGIDAAIADRIFDPYFTTRGFENNTGLGLAVVRGIIRNHNARIDFTRTPGAGTTFTVLFPEVE